MADAGRQTKMTDDHASKAWARVVDDLISECAYGSLLEFLCSMRSDSEFEEILAKDI